MASSAEIEWISFLDDVTCERGYKGKAKVPSALSSIHCDLVLYPLRTFFEHLTEAALAAPAENFYWGTQ